MTTTGVSLVKNQKIDLNKQAASIGHTLTRLVIGLGWDAKSSLVGGDAYDLDASALALDASGKVISQQHFVFWGNLKSPEGAIEHLGDNLTGDGDGDDEEIIIDLAKVPAGAAKIVFAVTIYEAEKRGQTFGEVDNSFIRAIDDQGAELARYNLDMESALDTVVTFGELINNNGSWVFSAKSSGFPAGFAAFVQQYGIQVA